MGYLVEVCEACKRIHKGEWVMSIFCKIGLHSWYEAMFAIPVWGRFERHCLNCNKKTILE